MATIVGICNRALQKLGVERITDIADTNKRATACNNCYESLRDALLRMHPWRFATKRSEAIAAISPAPTWGRANAFQVPSDFIRLTHQYPEDNSLTIDHEIEGQTIVTDDGAPLYIRYIYKVTDPNVMDPLFREALAAFMALEMCEEITNSNTKKESLDKGFKDAIATARKANAFEGPAARPPQDDWIDARA